MTAPVENWDVWGNAAAVGQLKDAVANNRLSHAYLLAGPESIGKMRLAMAFAKAVHCQNPPGIGEACGECLSCRKIERGVHPDVQTWSLASQTLMAAGKQSTKNTTLTIETVRSMIATAALRPMEGRWRVAIVDDAGSLQETAQEALLKTLEEPPSFTVIFLLAGDVESLLPTIRSRGQLIELRPAAQAEITRGLLGIGVPAADAAELAALANGAPGWAVAAFRDERLKTGRIEAIDRAIAWADSGRHERIVAAIRMGDGFAKDRGRVFAELSMLAGVWRDAMLIAAGQERFVHFQLRLTQLRTLATRWPLAASHRALVAVRACIGDLEANVRPRLAIEHMVLQWPTQ